MQFRIRTRNKQRIIFEDRQYRRKKLYTLFQGWKKGGNDISENDLFTMRPIKPLQNNYMII